MRIWMTAGLATLMLTGSAGARMNAQQTAKPGARPAAAYTPPKTPWGDPQIGGVYSNLNDGSGLALKDFSWDVGGGIDIFSHTAKGPDGRDHSAGLGFRVQYDYIVRTGDGANFHRVSAGVVWRILKEHK